jgi:hypothetical protein
MNLRPSKNFMSNPKKAIINPSLILIIGSVLLVISIIGIVYNGQLAIKDEVNKNLVGKNALPETGLGPLSVYHLEYGFVFLLIAGFAAVVWGYVSKQERKVNPHNLH